MAKKRGKGRPRNPECPKCGIKSNTSQVMEWQSIASGNTRENYVCKKCAPEKWKKEKKTPPPKKPEPAPPKPEPAPPEETTFDVRPPSLGDVEKWEEPSFGKNWKPTAFCAHGGRWYIKEGDEWDGPYEYLSVRQRGDQTTLAFSQLNKTIIRFTDTRGDINFHLRGNIPDKKELTVREACQVRFFLWTR